MKKANRGPVYAAALYPELAELVRLHGYALAVHGSIARDFDLVCIPWVEVPIIPKNVVDRICSVFSIKTVKDSDVTHHGRIRYTVSIGFGDCFIDLSFMPADKYRNEHIELSKEFA